MNASRALDRMERQEAAFDFDEFFRAHYARIARTIARVVGNHARAEELAVEAFWKLWRNSQAHGEMAGGWVYRTAVRLALNDLRGARRRHHYEQMSGSGPAALTPEEARAAAEEREHVRLVLAALGEREAALLLLRSSGLPYVEVAAALDLNPASVGTMIGRAQQAFRKEYLKLYGEKGNER
ncbi:MAG: sigma-70 family RNA polymerase sigma factor [Candidatus Sulfopaludibacter sp.]|nr:sigma-70 family RNA polymerase sigma factor [Candidatus Sulfopaludibacter sp.]